ncbi:hypothetical protein IL306_004790 [Fusarium sp. DS 682]|nr:hypothetical protein IL306_004790 [Fusarium sp. DS 682]
MRDIRREIGDVRREIRDGFRRVDGCLDTLQTDVASIKVRLHNLEAQSKNEEAVFRRADFVPLVKRDGAPIPNFPVNEAAVKSLGTRAINSLLTDLGVAWEGRNLDIKKSLFLREIGIKTSHNG